MTSPIPAATAERLENLDALDPVAEQIGKKVRALVPDGPAKDGLSGVWLGHALHPLLTDLPIGTFTSALLLDLLGGPGSRAAADRLIGLGIAATPAVAATGWTEWADTEVADPGVRRVGVVHAALNGTAVALMGASLVARRRGARGRGKLLSLAGVGLMSGGGWLGGHLSFARGVGVATTVFDQELAEWTDTGFADADLPEGRPVCALAGEVPVFLLRQNGEIRALHNRCSHRGGPLHEGAVADGTVTCPWHHSAFSLADGSVERGPAAYPQPVYDTRISDGRIEVRGRGQA